MYKKNKKAGGAASPLSVEILYSEFYILYSAF